MSYNSSQENWPSEIEIGTGREWQYILPDTFSSEGIQWQVQTTKFMCLRLTRFNGCSLICHYEEVSFKKLLADNKHLLSLIFIWLDMGSFYSLVDHVPVDCISQVNLTFLDSSLFLQVTPELGWPESGHRFPGVTSPTLRGIQQLFLPYLSWSS